jgi:hypothetical protein
LAVKAVLDLGRIVGGSEFRHGGDSLPSMKAGEKPEERG